MVHPTALLAKIPLSPKARDWLGQHGKTAFWLWVIYQAIKGILTTSLIWVPLLLAMCHMEG